MQPLINLQYTTIKDPLPDFIYKGLKTYSAGANLYRPQPEELISQLAKKHKLPKEMFFLTVGIDEAIQMLAMTFGQNAFVFTPTYSVYADVRIFGGKLTEIYSIKNNQYTISTDKINKASLIFLANPNNPSGITSKENVLKLIKNNSSAVVVIDEAYSQFSNLSVITQVPKYKNLVVFRSFSKDYSMAGNRIGYIVAHPKIIKQVADKSQWANVSYLSVGAAITALKHEAYFSKIRKGINHRRDLFHQFLKDQGFITIPSHINAVLIKFPSVARATQFVKHLNQNNIIVSHGGGNSNIGLDKSFVRIAIGNAQQMKTVQQVIKKFKYSTG